MLQNQYVIVQVTEFMFFYCEVLRTGIACESRYRQFITGCRSNFEIAKNKMLKLKIISQFFLVKIQTCSFNVK